MPRSVQHFHVAEPIQPNAAPVVRRSRRPQTGFAFSAELVAKHPELPFPVPSQPVRAKQAVAIVVSGRDWTPALDGRAYNPVNIGQQANSARSRSATHTFRLLLASINPKASIVYNTVVLGHQGPSKWFTAAEVWNTAMANVNGTGGRQHFRLGGHHVG